MANAAFDAAARATLVEGARVIAERGLVVGSAGNLSVRSGDAVLITPRGALLEAIDPRDCVAIAMRDGAVGDGHASDSRPSSESALHRSIYDATDAGAIVHTHSHYATVLSTLVDELPAVHYAIAAFGGPVRVARYETFGTDELAAAVTEALAGRTAALMANHGAVVTGRDIEHAVAMALQLEWLASVHYHAMVAGTPTILSEAELDAVRQRARELSEDPEGVRR
jgi:L-fuculose-phosphate aldolase